ncbi:MAG: redoxin domain-containing protein [Anaerolineales bacterium]|nr:redoxin domain-containing protein [Anaerolineales bacterium]
MAEQSGNNLQYIEQLLREGKKQDALPLLAHYLRQYPNSVQAWWLLSFAISNVKKRIECMERVLRIDPEHKLAQARLEKLKGDVTAPFAETIAPDTAVVPNQRPQPDSPSAVLQKPHLQRKRIYHVFWDSLLVVMACITVGTTALGVTIIVRGSLGSASFTQFFIPPTQTPVGKPLINLPLTATIPESQIAPETGYYAPDFSLINVNSNTRASLSNCKGKAVIIYFWTTWCQYCKAQMPAVQTIYKNYKSRGLVVLAVDVGENASDVRKYRDANFLTFPILNDTDGDVSSEYRVTAFPTLFFVDPSGIISSVNIGSMDYAGLNNKVKIILGLAP